MIRRATLDDVKGLRAAVIAAYAPFADQGIGLPPVAEGLDADIRDHLVWVADDRGIILGGIVLVISDGHAHLANVAVHPDFAGKGLGRELIDTAQSEAMARGCTEMSLTTHPEMTATIGFYEKLGWVVTGRERDKVFMTTQLFT
jgi:ribosomal protein S18 acetylase RimI-like enzyme